MALRGGLRKNICLDSQHSGGIAWSKESFMVFMCRKKRNEKEKERKSKEKKRKKERVFWMGFEDDSIEKLWVAGVPGEKRGRDRGGGERKGRGKEEERERERRESDPQRHTQ